MALSQERSAAPARVGVAPGQPRSEWPCMLESAAYQP